MADFSSIHKEECRDLKIPDGCVLGSSRTVVLQSVLNEIKEHGRSSMHAEVCGVLVGSLCWDESAYLMIDGRIEGKHASHQSGSVTFTSETWDSIHEELAAKYPNRIIVGWYHTHPGFGIFLSNMDAFIHDNFFSFPWEPAYVFDPQAETDGFFFRVGTELVQEEVSISLDVEPSVREPQARFIDADKIVIEGTPRRRYLMPAILSVSVVGCFAVAAVAMFAIEKSRSSGQETSADKHEAMALCDNCRKKTESTRESDIHKLTYANEFAGMRVELTITTGGEKHRPPDKGQHDEAVCVNTNSVTGMESHKAHGNVSVNCNERDWSPVMYYKRYIYKIHFPFYPQLKPERSR